jgi:hypothetical protein
MFSHDAYAFKDSVKNVVSFYGIVVPGYADG